jgi:hypothetical protein
MDPQKGDQPRACICDRAEEIVRFFDESADLIEQYRELLAETKRLNRKAALSQPTDPMGAVP